MMDFKTYHALPEEAVFIRETVFVKEQGFAEELDDIDAIATHIVLYNKESMPVATCRYFWDKELNAWVVGRIAVLKEFREKHYGTAVLHEAERQIRENGAEKVCLAAQVRAKGFYEKIGYFAIGDEFLEEHCPHIRMCKNLKGQDRRRGRFITVCDFAVPDRRRPFLPVCCQNIKNTAISHKETLI